MMNRNFNEIYEKINRNGIEELDELNKKRNIALAIVAVLLIALIVTAPYIFNTPFIWLGIALVFLGMFRYIMVSREYKSKFKTRVIAKLIYEYNPEFNYDCDRGIPRHEYDGARFDYDYNQYYTEDLIHGYLKDGGFFQMAQVHTSLKTEHRDSDGSIHTDTKEIFNGIFGIIETNGRILTDIDVTLDSIFARFDRDRIEVDSSEFEKKYDLFSRDKVRAMEIFTSDLIEEFNQFDNDTGYKIQVRAFSNRLYFRISCGEVFEAPLFKKATDYGVLYKYFRMIDSPIIIAEKLMKNAIETR